MRTASPTFSTPDPNYLATLNSLAKLTKQDVDAIMANVTQEQVNSVIADINKRHQLPTTEPNFVAEFNKQDLEAINRSLQHSVKNEKPLPPILELVLLDTFSASFPRDLDISKDSITVPTSALKQFTQDMTRFAKTAYNMGLQEKQQADQETKASQPKPPSLFKKAWEAVPFIEAGGVLAAITLLTVNGLRKNPSVVSPEAKTPLALAVYALAVAPSLFLALVWAPVKALQAAGSAFKPKVSS